jgi:DNA-binding transcriptional LysR family regulator
MQPGPFAAESGRRAARGETGSIRLGCTSSAAFNPYVPTSIRAFRRRSPGVELSLQESNSSGLVDGLVDGTPDAAFLRPQAVGDEELTIYEFEREPMIAAL